MIITGTYVNGKYLMYNQDWLHSGMHVLSEAVLLESSVNNDYSPGWAYIAFAGIKMDSYISKIYCSHWEPPEVSERRRSVNLEVSL